MATLTLVYDDEQETELRLSGVSFRTYYALATEWDAIARGQTEPEGIMAYYARFADTLLVRWTYPEDPTGEHFLDRDIGYVKAVIRDWFEAMTEVAPPFASAVFRYRAVPGAVDRTTGQPSRPPIELQVAQLTDEILTKYPGYTLRTLNDEDAFELLQLRKPSTPI